MTVCKPLWAVLALCLSGVSGTAQACGPYRVAMSPYPVVAVERPDGSLHGSEPDIVAAMAQRSGCTLVMATSSSARTWPALAAGEVDIGALSIVTPEREQLAEFVPMVRVRQFLLLHRSADADQVNDAAGFLAQRSLRLGLVKRALPAGPSQQWIHSLREQGRISEAGDKPALMRAFDAKRLDAVTAYPLELAGKDADWWRQHRLVDGFPGPSYEVGWALSRQRVNAADRARLQAAALSLHRDGSIRRVLRAHLGDELARTVLPAEGQR